MDVPLSAEFTDPRLVAVYDSLNPYDAGTQPAFYLRLAEELGARSVLDVGCGTGLVTREFVDRGYAVTALEPSAEMIAVARRRIGEDRATFLAGGTALLGALDADLAFLSGHVAQFFLTDVSWQRALNDLRRALRTGGTLAFETRNPAVREWETWSDGPPRVSVDPVAGRIETWTRVDDVDAGIVSCTLHYRFLDTGEELAAANRLRFRTPAELEASLADAGFAIEETFGGWDRRPFEADSAEIILVARAI
ncbi:class I SAM-dependent methyltransferase [Microbacteriaceae bacterium 4G12]